MHILYFADTRFPIERANGVQTMATCHALARRGHDVTLVVRPDLAPVARDPFEFYSLPREPRLKVRAISGPRAPRARRAHFLLSAAALAAGAPGVVYTRDLGVAAFLLQMPLRKRARLVYESHGVADVVGAELPRLLAGEATAPSAAKLARLARREARVWRRAASYVTITQALADELAVRFGPRASVFVAPDGADVDAVARISSPPVAGDARDVVVGYAGHLYPWKGVDVLVAAIARVPSIRAVIVGGHPGEGDRQRVEALARRLSVEDRITFLGLVPQAAVAGCLSPATILVLPNTASAISERYTSPLKLFEYLALGRAIVASDLPAIREILTDRETALLVPPGDASALAAAIETLRVDPALRSKLGAAARALAPEYSWGRRAERLERAIEAAVA